MSSESTAFNSVKDAYNAGRIAYDNNYDRVGKANAEMGSLKGKMQGKIRDLQEKIFIERATLIKQSQQNNEYFSDLSTIFSNIKPLHTTLESAISYIKGGKDAITEDVLSYLKRLLPDGDNSLRSGIDKNEDHLKTLEGFKKNIEALQKTITKCESEAKVVLNQYNDEISKVFQEQHSTSPLPVKESPEQNERLPKSEPTEPFSFFLFFDDL